MMPVPSTAIGEEVAAELLTKELDTIVSDHKDYVDSYVLVIGLGDVTMRRMAYDITQQHGWWSVAFMTPKEKLNPPFDADVKISHPSWVNPGDELIRFATESDVFLLLADNDTSRAVAEIAYDQIKRVYCDKMV